MEAAAAHGHIQVLRALPPRRVDMHDLFVVAAANGQVQVLQFLMEHPKWELYHIGDGLQVAAERGHCGVVELLLDTSQKFELRNVFDAAANAGQFGVMRLLLERYDPDERLIAYGIQFAIEKKNNKLVELILECCPRMPTGHPVDDEEAWRSLHPAQNEIDFQFTRAVDGGFVETVKLLFNRVAISVGEMLLQIADYNQVPVMETVLEQAMLRTPASRNTYRKLLNVLHGMGVQKW